MANPGPNVNVPQVGSPGADVRGLIIDVQLLKQGVESLAGDRGDPLDRAVTYRDLIALGLVSQLTVQSQGGVVTYATMGDLAALLAAPVAYAALPDATTNRRLAVVTDSIVKTWGAVISGGGAFRVLAWWNGAQWTVIGA